MTTHIPKNKKGKGPAAAVDPIDEYVASVVADTVGIYRASKRGMGSVWRELTGDFPRKIITWEGIEHLIEDQYRERNNLLARKGKRHDDNNLSKSGRY